MIRPSNSGMATCMAASIGVIELAAAQSARELVRQIPCMIGMSRSARAPMLQAASSPPADASEGTTPPAASTVTISASQPLSSWSTG